MSGTPSMKFFMRKIDIGNAVVAMNAIVPLMVSMRLSCTNRP